jgi:hypothetical protein
MGSLGRRDKGRGVRDEAQGTRQEGRGIREELANRRLGTSVF